MEYERTQRGYFHFLLYAMALAAYAGAWVVREAPPVMWVLLGTAAVFCGCGALFGSLTVRGEAQHLSLVFGPLPLVGKKIRYADITAVETDRTILLDGWGIHYIPGRGWTYNIWGFRCVKLTLGKKVLRIGTDDPEGLARFLQGKMAGSPTATGP